MAALPLRNRAVIAAAEVQVTATRRYRVRSVPMPVIIDHSPQASKASAAVRVMELRQRRESRPGT
jgi:hypothetical protein